MQPKIQKFLGMGDITLLTFISNFGVRWLAVAAAIGASSIFYWILGAILLAIPMTFMAAQLSRLYPEEGGIYAWARHALGEKSGFIVAWLYLVNNLFYYPAVLIFLATNFAYFLGKPELANNAHFVCITVLISFWVIVLVSLLGLKTNKILSEYAGIAGSILPAAIIILLALIILIWTHHTATSFHWQTIVPNQHISHSLANLSMIMFAMTGIEIIPTFANSVKNPKRDLYYGVLIGSFLMITFYIIGTLAINVISSPSDIHKASGLISAFQSAFLQLHLPDFTRLIAFLLIFAEIAVVTIWLVAPITMFFKCTPKGLIPDWFKKTNKQQTPVNAIMFMGLLVTIILLATNLLPGVNDIYQILVLMSALLVFLPYVFLTFTYKRNIPKIHFPSFLKWFFVVATFFSLSLGIIFSFALPSNLITLNSKLLYELELFLGPVIFLGLGYWIYHHGVKRGVVKRK